MLEIVSSSFYQHALEEAAIILEAKGEAGLPSLRGHIVNGHFSPGVLAWYGVARFDIDLAKLMEIPLTWVVKGGVKILEQGWKSEYRIDFESLPDKHSSTVFRRFSQPWGPKWCREMIVRNFLYIEQQQLAEIDWVRVQQAVPNAHSLTLNLGHDSYDFLIPSWGSPISRPPIQQPSLLTTIRNQYPTFWKYFKR
jgi:hypothetical protein